MANSEKVTREYSVLFDIQNKISKKERDEIYEFMKTFKDFKTSFLGEGKLKLDFSATGLNAIEKNLNLIIDGIKNDLKIPVSLDLDHMDKMVADLKGKINGILSKDLDNHKFRPIEEIFGKKDISRVALSVGRDNALKDASRIYNEYIKSVKEGSEVSVQSLLNLVDAIEKVYAANKELGVDRAKYSAKGMVGVSENETTDIHEIVKALQSKKSLFKDVNKYLEETHKILSGLGADATKYADAIEEAAKKTEKVKATIKEKAPVQVQSSQNVAKTATEAIAVEFDQAKINESLNKSAYAAITAYNASGDRIPVEAETRVLDSYKGQSILAQLQSIKDTHKGTEPVIELGAKAVVNAHINLVRKEDDETIKVAIDRQHLLKDLEESVGTNIRYYNASDSIQKEPIRVNIKAEYKSEEGNEGLRVPVDRQFFLKDLEQAIGTNIRYYNASDAVEKEFIRVKVNPEFESGEGKEGLQIPIDRQLFLKDLQETVGTYIRYYNSSDAIKKELVRVGINVTKEDIESSINNAASQIKKLPEVSVNVKPTKDSLNKLGSDFAGVVEKAVTKALKTSLNAQKQVIQDAFDNAKTKASVKNKSGKSKSSSGTNYDELSDAQLQLMVLDNINKGVGVRSKDYLIPDDIMHRKRADLIAYLKELDKVNAEAAESPEYEKRYNEEIRIRLKLEKEILSIRDKMLRALGKNNGEWVDEKDAEYADRLSASLEKITSGRLAKMDAAGLTDFLHKYQDVESSVNRRIEANKELKKIETDTAALIKDAAKAEEANAKAAEKTRIEAEKAAKEEAKRRAEVEKSVLALKNKMQSSLSKNKGGWFDQADGGFASRLSNTLEKMTPERLAGMSAGSLDDLLKKYREMEASLNRRIEANKEWQRIEKENAELLNVAKKADDANAKAAAEAKKNADEEYALRQKHVSLLLKQEELERRIKELRKYDSTDKGTLDEFERIMSGFDLRTKTEGGKLFNKAEFDGAALGIEKINRALSEMERAIIKPTSLLSDLRSQVNGVVKTDLFSKISGDRLRTDFVGSEQQLRNIEVLRDRILQLQQEVNNLDRELTPDEYNNKLAQYKKDVIDLKDAMERLPRRSLFGERQGLIDREAIKSVSDFRNLIKEIEGIGAGTRVTWSDKYKGDIVTMTGAYEDEAGAIKTVSYSLDTLNGTYKKVGASEKQQLSFTERLTKLFKQRSEALLAYIGTFASFYRVMGEMRKGVEIIKLLDTNMTELRRVSGATTDALNSFRASVYDIGREIGSTGDNIIKLAADYARLGYSLNEASELARASAIYMNVGFIDDANFAMESLTSTMKAYGMQASEVTSIVDKFNEVGNSFAISSQGIGEALKRSAAALSQANNDLDKSIALVVAANNVVQDPQVVGTALRTVALRIRGAKGELEEMGEDVTGLADSVSTLRDEVLALSGVDIMIDDNTFKDTYDIMLELSRVWYKLSDVSQAALLEKIAGKRGANAVASILSNVKDLEAAYATAQNAAGSAAIENAKYLESIEGRISQLKASWQEFWDSSILSSGIKAGVSGLNVLVTALDKIGGMDFALTVAGLAGLYAGVNKLKGSVGVLASIVRSVNDLSLAMKDFNGKKLHLGDLIFGKDFVSEKTIRSNVNSLVESVTGAYSSAFSLGKGTQSAATTGMTEALKELERSQINVSESSKQMLRSFVEVSGQQATNITLEEKQKLQTRLLANEMENGAKKSALLANAQKVLVASIKAASFVIVSLAITAIRKYAQEQDELRQSIIDNAKDQVDSARSLRKALSEFKRVDNDFKNNEASQEAFRSAIEKVNEALGDQINLLEGYTPGSEEWRKRVEQLTEDQSKAAKRAADAAVTASIEQTTKEKALDFFLGRSPIAKNRGGDVNKFTRSGQITLIKQWQDELDELNERYDELLERQEEAQNTGDKRALGGLFGFGGINKEIKDNIKQRQDLTADIRRYTDKVDETVEKLADSIAEGRIRNADTASEFYKILKDEMTEAIELYDLPLDDTFELLEDKLKSIFPVFFTQIEDAENAIKKLGMSGATVDELLDKFNQADLTKLASPEFSNYVEQERLFVKTTDQAVEVLKKFTEQKEKDARQTNTLTGQLNANKEAIDKYQESLQKLTSIASADYSGNASGMLDDLQDLIEILGGLDADVAGKFFDKINNSFSVDALTTAMREVSEEAAKIKIDEIVDQMNLANPVFKEMTKLMLEQSRQVETLTSDLDSFKSAYQSLTSVIKDYNENGFLTADNINAILSMSPEYLAALDFEGNKLKFNHDALKALVKMRLADAERQIEANRHTRISAIYAEQEARSKGKAAELTYEHAQALLEEAIAAGKSENEIIHLEKQVQRLYEKRERLSGQTYSGKLDEDLQEQVDAINESSDAAVASIRYVGEEFDKGSDDALAKFMGLTDSIEKETKDASKELKSQIDSTLSHWKSALDSGAINYKQYLDKMKAMRDQYADQLSMEDLLQMDVDIAQEEQNMWKEAIDAAGRYVDREMIKPIQDRIEGLSEEKEALEANKQAVSDYYDGIIDGYQKQKDAIEDQIKAVEKSYEAQIKPLEDQQKANNKVIKSIEKQKRAIEDQIKALEKSKRPYEKQQKAIQKNIKAIEKQIKALEKTKKPYEQQQKAIDKQIKSIEKQIRALEKTKRPYEQQQKAIDKQIKAIEKQIKALERTKRPYEQQKKEIDKQVKAIQRQIRAIEDTKKPYEDQQKAIDKQIKAIQKQIKALEKSKRPYEQQRKEIDKQVKAIEKQIKALEKTKKPYEEQQKAIEKETKAIQKEIKEIQKTEEPYKEEQKLLQKSIRAIEQKIKALEKLQKPYKDQLTLVNNEIAALEREIELIERTKTPLEQRKQAIQNQIDALEHQTSVIERQETAYKREQDAINREIELLERQVSILEHRKKPYEIAQRQIEKQINLLQKQQKELEKLKKPYEDEIDALQKELELMQKANEERQFAMELQQAEYNLRRAQQQRTSYVYQDGQFQYVADQGAIKDAQKAMDDLEYEKSVKRVESAIDELQAKIDEITKQSDAIQDEIDELTDQNEALADSIQQIQDQIDPLQDKIDDLIFKNDELEWSISDIEWSMRNARYAIEDLETEMEDLEEEIRQIDVELQPLQNRLEELKNTASDLQWEIDKIQQSINPLNDEISGLNERIEELQLTIDEIEESVEPLQKRIEELTEKNEELQESIDEITESIEPLQEQIEELGEQSDEIQEKIDEITEAIEPLNDQIDELTEQSDEIQEIIDGITDSIDELNDQIDDLNRQGDEIQDKIDEIDEAIQPLQDSIEELNDASEELQEQIDAIDEAIEPLQESIEELNEQSEELQDAIDAIDEAIEPLQESIEELNEEMDSLQEYIDAIDEEIEVLNEQLEPLNDQIEELNRQNEDLSEAIEELREQQELEVEALKAQSEAIDEQIDYYQKLKEQAGESIQAQIDKIDEHVDALQKEITEIEKYKDSLTDIFDEIDRRKDEDLLTSLFGEGWQEKLKSLDPNIIAEFARGYEDSTERLKEANQAVIDSLEGPEGLEQAADKAEAEVTELKDTMEQGEAAMGAGSMKDAMDQTAITAVGLVGDIESLGGKVAEVCGLIAADLRETEGLLDVHVTQKLQEIKTQIEKDLPEAFDYFKRVIVDDDGPQIILQLQAINEELKTFGQTIDSDTIPAFERLRDFIEGGDFKDRIIQAFSDIKDSINAEVDAVVTHLTDEAIPNAEGAVNAFKDVVNQVFTEIREHANSELDSVFVRLKDEILPETENDVRSFRDNVNQLFTETKNHINKEIDEIVRHLADDALPTAENAIKETLERVAGETDSLLSNLRDMVEKRIDEICGKGGLVQVGCQNVTSYVENMSDSVLSDVQDLVRDVENEIDDLMSYVRSEVDDLVRDINSEIDGIVSVVEQSCDDIKREIQNTVDEICGMLDDITQKVNDIRDAAWSAADAIGAISERLGWAVDPASSLREIFWNIEGSVKETRDALDGVVEKLQAAADASSNIQVPNAEPGAGEAGDNAQDQDQRVPEQDSVQVNSDKAPSSEDRSGKTTEYQGGIKMRINSTQDREEAEKLRWQGYDIYVEDNRGAIIEVLERYAKGGVVSGSSNSGALTSIAKSVGEDKLIAVKNGERVLSPKQTRDFEKLVEMAPNLVKQLKNAQGNLNANMSVSVDTSDAIAGLQELERKVQDTRRSIDNTLDNINKSAKNKMADAVDYINGSEGIGRVLEAVDSARNDIVGEGGIVPTATESAKTNINDSISEIAGEGGMMDTMTDWIREDMDNLTGEEGIIPYAMNTAKTTVDTTLNEIAGEGGLMDQFVENVNDDVSQIEQRVTEGSEYIRNTADELSGELYNASGMTRDQINSDIDNVVNAARFGGENIANTAREVSADVMNSLSPIQDLINSINWSVGSATESLRNFAAEARIARAEIDSLNNSMGDNLGSGSGNLAHSNGSDTKVNNTGRYIIPTGAKSDANGRIMTVAPGESYSVPRTTIKDPGRKPGSVTSASRSSSNASSSNSNTPSVLGARRNASNNTANNASNNSGGTNGRGPGNGGDTDPNFEYKDGYPIVEQDARNLGVVYPPGMKKGDTYWVRDKRNGTMYKRKMGMDTKPGTTQNTSSEPTQTGGESTRSSSTPNPTTNESQHDHDDHTEEKHYTDINDIRCPECGSWRVSARHKLYWHLANYGIDKTIETFGEEALAKMANVSETALRSWLKNYLESGKFATGGVVPKASGKDFFTELANSVGEDKMIAVQSGERVLTQDQNRDFENLVKLTPELINASESLAKYAKLFDTISTANSLASEDNILRNVNGVVNRANAAPVMNNAMSLTIGDIHVHDVSNADDLARQIKNNLPNSLLQALGRTG